MHTTAAPCGTVLLVLIALGASGQELVPDAVMDGNARALQAAIASGADVNVKDGDGVTALMHAASAGRVDLLEMLLAAKAEVNATTADGATALMAAAFSGYAEAVRILLDHQAEPNRKDQQGRTPLMAAALNGHADVVRALLAKGADVRIVDLGGGGPITYAAAKGHADVLDTLLKAGAKWTDSDLAVAAEGCYPQVLEAMLKSGANPNATRNGQPATGEAPKVVVANGVEAEPMSVKDLVLLTRTPHLVIDHFGLIGANTVSLDRAAGMQAMMNHLLDFGHRMFGLVGITKGPVSRIDRLTGIQAALRARGLDFDACTLSLDHLHERQNDFQYGRKLAASFLELPSIPTA